MTENVPAKSDSSSSEENSTWEFIKVILQALALAIVVRTLIFQPFSIPSGSMKPNLLVGDYLFVSKMSYGYSRYSVSSSVDLKFKGRIWASDPVRGDVIVFKFPPDPSLDYIKRLVGLPGDRIQIIDSIIHINGVPVKRELKGEFLDKESNISVPIYQETMANGVTYETLDIRETVGDNTGVFEVPEGHYFMMGDNRDNSSDSRFTVGFVPAENLVGRAKFVFFSVSDRAHPLAFWRWFSTIRTDRFFTGL